MRGTPAAADESPAAGMATEAAEFVSGYPNPARGKQWNGINLEQVCEAAYQGNLASLETLLKTGDENSLFNGDLDAYWTDVTALHIASIAGQKDAVKMLLEAKADPHMRTRARAGQAKEECETARDKATKWGYNEISTMLQKAEKAYPYGRYDDRNIKLRGPATQAAPPTAAKKKEAAPPSAAKKKEEAPPPPAKKDSKKEEKEAKVNKRIQGAGLVEEPAKAQGPPLPVALLFPGQGSQVVGMLKTAKDLPAVQEMLEKAKPILGYDLLELCLQGPESKLEETRYCQPAMFVGGLAGRERLRTEKPEVVDRCQAVAGLSLGEYTALCACGVMSFEDGLQLVKLRGEAMQEAAARSEQGMLSVAGLDEAKLSALCKEAAAKDGPGAVCCIANHLFPKGFSCAGSKQAIIELEKLAKDAGALQARQLKTSGAFHTPLMEEAKAKLEKALQEILPRLKPPRCTIYMNVTGQPLLAGADPKDMVSLLTRQLVSPVLWEPSVRKMLADGVSECYECGPNKQLKAMLKRIDQKAWNKATNVEV